MTDYAAMEAEANAFAMELLMPFDWIARDAANIDLCDDRAIERLAKKYRVPASTMAIRIGEVRSESGVIPTPAETGGDVSHAAAADDGPGIATNPSFSKAEGRTP